MIISLGGFIVSLSTSFPFQYDFTIVPGRLTEYIYLYIYITPIVIKIILKVKQL